MATTRLSQHPHHSVRVRETSGCFRTTTFLNYCDQVIIIIIKSPLLLKSLSTIRLAQGHTSSFIYSSLKQSLLNSLISCDVPHNLEVSLIYSQSGHSCKHVFYLFIYLKWHKQSVVIQVWCLHCDSTKPDPVTFRGLHVATCSRL